jgi:hypothetical protein
MQLSGRSWWEHVLSRHSVAAEWMLGHWLACGPLCVFIATLKMLQTLVHSLDLDSKAPRMFPEYLSHAPNPKRRSEH